MAYESFRSALERERKIEEILLSPSPPLTKIERIKDLGVEEEDASDLVERYQLGQLTPLYYESLEFGVEEEQEE